MGTGNETALRDYRFIDESYFNELYEAFTRAFSDYVFPFALTETQFKNHIILNGVDLCRTIACFEEERIVGFSLNGFGEWQGKVTAYDAGTGVIPEARRQGISDAMFEMMMPIFKQKGVEQFLLEVITSNHGAIRLYEKLAFRTVRDLALLQCDGPIKKHDDTPQNIEICQISDPEWAKLATFWDGQPSWQNSIDAIKRSVLMKRIWGAFEGERCVGYIVFSANFGRIAQVAVDKAHRNHGIGTALVQKMQELTADGYSLQVVNIDKSVRSAMDFFLNRGFYERLSQHEMLMRM